MVFYHLKFPKNSIKNQIMVSFKTGYPTKNKSYVIKESHIFH